MTEINNPKKYCNDSQSGSQQLPQDPCNCVPNIIAGPNIALTPNEDGSVTISAVVTDTDTILNNPHFIPGAPAGFNRLSYDLFNKLTNTTITADYTYVDIPDQDIQTLSIAGNNLSISNGNTIPLPTDTVTNTIAGNTIATHTAVDGTVVNINESLITPVNTPTVNLTASGIGDHTIAADVKVSSTAGNSLIVGPDGLFVPPIPTCEDMQDCVAPMFSSVGFTYDDVNNQIDTTGTNGQILQANGTGGATWVTPAAGHVAATTVDSSTVDFTQSGTDNQTITATVKVSAAVGNDIVVNADGLFVDVPTCEDIQDCVAPMMLSNGFVYDDVNNQLDTTGTNGQVLTANGTGGADWQTPTATAQTPVTPLDSTNIDVTATGTDNHTVGASIIFDPNVLNVAKDTGTGLLVDVNEIALAVCASPTDLSCLSLATTGTAAPVIVKEEFFPLSGNTITVANTPTTYFPMQVFLGNGTAFLLGEAPGPIEVHPDMTTFPVTGVVGTTYLDQSMNTFYVWDTGTSSYVVTQPVYYTRSGSTLTFAYDFFGGDTVRVWYSY